MGQLLNTIKTHFLNLIHAVTNKRVSPIHKTGLPGCVQWLCEAERRGGGVEGGGRVCGRE